MWLSENWESAKFVHPEVRHPSFLRGALPAILYRWEAAHEVLISPEVDRKAADSTTLHMWAASALSTYKNRKWSFKRFLNSPAMKERKFRDAFWLGLTYRDWQGLFIPTECPTEARCLLEAAMPNLGR